MAKLKSKTQCLVELKEEDYLMLLENTIKMEALKIAGIENMSIYKAMEHILKSVKGLPEVKRFMNRLTGEVALTKYVLNMTENHMKPNMMAAQIGRASCRERVCLSV